MKFSFTPRLKAITNSVYGIMGVSVLEQFGQALLSGKHLMGVCEHPKASKIISLVTDTINNSITQRFVVFNNRHIHTVLMTSMKNRLGVSILANEYDDFEENTDLQDIIPHTRELSVRLTRFDTENRTHYIVAQSNGDNPFLKPMSGVSLKNSLNHRSVHNAVSSASVLINTLRKRDLI